MASITKHVCLKTRTPIQYNDDMAASHPTTGHSEVVQSNIRCAKPPTTGTLHECTLSPNTVAWTSAADPDNPDNWAIRIRLDGTHARVVCTTFPGGGDTPAHYVGIVDDAAAATATQVCAIKVCGRAMLQIDTAAGAKFMIGARLFATPWTQIISTTREVGQVYIGIVVAPVTTGTYLTSMIEISIGHSHA